MKKEKSFKAIKVLIRISRIFFATDRNYTIFYAKNQGVLMD
jgi:hypothetical protein